MSAGPSARGGAQGVVIEITPGENATAIITGTTTVTNVVTGVIEEGRSLPRLNAFESIISTAGGQHGADRSFQFSSQQVIGPPDTN